MAELRLLNLSSSPWMTQTPSEGSLIGHSLRVAVLCSDDVSTKIGIGPGGELELRPSYMYHVFMALQFSLNSSYTINCADQRGYYNETVGKWTGIIGQIANGDVDLSLIPYAPTLERLQVVEFNLPLRSMKLMGLFSHPNFHSERYWLLKPLRMDVWWALLAWSVLWILGLLALRRIYARLSCNSNEVQLPELLDSLLWALATLCQRGITKVPPTLPYRVLVLSTSLVFVVIYAVYSGTLLTFLHVGLEPISGLSKLLHVEYTVLRVKELTVQKDHFMGSPYQNVRELYRRSEATKPLDGVEDAKRELLTKRHVVVADAVRIYTALQNNFTVHEQCSVALLPIPLAPFVVATMVQRRSPFKRSIDYQFLKMRQFGLLQAWAKRFDPPEQACFHVGYMFSSIEFGDIYVPTHILATGTVVSFVILLAEKLSKISLR